MRLAMKTTQCNGCDKTINSRIVPIQYFAKKQYFSECSLMKAKLEEFSGGFCQWLILSTSDAEVFDTSMYRGESRNVGLGTRYTSRHWIYIDPIRSSMVQ
jgi:hypothetical protein